MKSPRGIIAIVLAVGVGSFLLISAFAQPGGARSVKVKIEGIVQVSKPEPTVRKAFDDLIAKDGPKVCKVQYYDKPGHKLWDKGTMPPLSMTSSTASKGGSGTGPGPGVSGAHLTQQISFTSVSSAAAFLSSIDQ